MDSEHVSASVSRVMLRPAEPQFYLSHSEHSCARATLSTLLRKPPVDARLLVHAPHCPTAAVISVHHMSQILHRCRVRWHARAEENSHAGPRLVEKASLHPCNSNAAQMVAALSSTSISLTLSPSTRKRAQLFGVGGARLATGARVGPAQSWCTWWHSATSRLGQAMQNHSNSCDTRAS